MKLSEAILLGSVAVKPVAGSDCERKGGGCALTMAVIASGSFDRERSYIWAQAKDIWPWLNVTPATTPCGCEPRLFNNWQFLIAHVFDSHVMKKDGWTLEKLVDYVRSIEPEEHDGTTLTKLELAVRYAEMNAGIERSSDSETSDEMGAAVSQGFRP